LNSLQQRRQVLWDPKRLFSDPDPTFQNTFSRFLMKVNQTIIIKIFRKILNIVNFIL
jgi:hypothetical protein